MYLCPNWTGTLTAAGIRWSCDDYHPEVLAQLGLDDPFDGRQHNGAGGLVNGISEHNIPSRKDTTPDEHD